MNTETTISSISDAKPRLGRLIKRALAGEPVFIGRAQGSSDLVQLVPVPRPEPIPYYPPGAIKMTRSLIAATTIFPLLDNPFE